MKYRIVSIAIVAVLCLTGCSDDTPTGVDPVDDSIVQGDVFVYSQTELEELSSKRMVTGYLVLESITADDPIGDLTPLAELVEAEGLYIIATEVKDLTALVSLEQVGDLVIAENDSLTSLAAMESFLAATRIAVVSCPQIASLGILDTLEGLTALTIADLPLYERLDLHASQLAELESLSLELLPALEFPEPLAAADLASLTAREVTSLTDLSWLGELPALTELRLDMGYRQFNSLAGSTSLPALEGLWIENCPGLTSLAGMAATPMLEELFITNCTTLSDFSDAGGLASVPELTIEYVALTDLQSLAAWTGCEQLTLVTCPVLTSLDGLAASAPLQELRLFDCDALTSLAGPTYPASFGTIWVEHCDGIASLAGAGTIADIEVLLLDQNLSLTSLGGMTALNTVELLGIKNNPVLGDEVIETFLGQLELVVQSVIRDNGGGL